MVKGELEMKEWLEKVIDFSEVMTPDEFRIILSMTDVTCQRCGNCCTSTAGRCKYLLGEKVFSCQLHPDKPTHCLEYPKIWDFDWVTRWRLAPPQQAVQMCCIVAKFWNNAWMFLQEKELVKS